MLGEVENFVKKQALPCPFWSEYCCECNFVLGILLEHLDGVLLEMHCVIFEEGHPQHFAISKTIALHIDQIFKFILVQ